MWYISFQNTYKQYLIYSGNWQQDTLSVESTDEKDASFSVKFKGTQIGLYGMARPDGGYARVVLLASKG